MYVPTIALIVCCVTTCQELTRQNGLSASLRRWPSAAVFAAQFYGTMAVPPAEFVAHLEGRMPTVAGDLLRYTHAFAYIWYQPLAQEIRDTLAAHARESAGRAGICLLSGCTRALAVFCAFDVGAFNRPSSPHRDRGIIGVSAAYLVMFAMVFDYSRWISNWAVCLF